MRRYYEEEVVRILGLAGVRGASSLEGFRHAFALVSSRAFMVDAYHGLAMVPIADAYVPIFWIVRTHICLHI